MVRYRPTFVPLALLMLLLASSHLGDAYATTNVPTVNRTFFFYGVPPQGSLGSSSPPSGLQTMENLSRAPIEFGLPTLLLSSLTVSGQPSFTVWTSGNSSTAQVQGVFSWKGLNDRSWSNSTNLPVQCPVGPASPVPCTFTFPQTIQVYLAPGAQLRVGVNATLPTKTYATMYWGEAVTHSQVILPISGYSSVGPVEIRDWTGSTTASFNLNATKGQNVVVVEAPITTALGKEDVRNVNLTIADPAGRPLQGAINITMSQFPPNNQPQSTYSYVGEWTYLSSLAEGNYQVWIDVVDVQGNIAFSLRGPYGFGLYRPGIHPLDLLPYAIIAAAGIVGGTFYFKRRKKKEYLVPFDHFYTLTAGAIPPGTMITVEGNTSSGKTLLLEQLMFDDLKAGRPCVFVSAADFPLKIRGGMRSLGLETEPYEGKDALKFVDCYSAEAGQPSQEKFYVSSTGDLTSLGVKITSAMTIQSEGPSVYFDSLTPLTPKSRAESVVSFAQTVGAKVRGMGGKVFFTVGSSVDETILRQLEESSDCIIQMEAFEESGLRRRRMRVVKFRNRKFREGWVAFTIEESKGINFYSKKSRS